MGFGTDYKHEVVIYHRYDANEVITVVLNFSDQDWEGPVPLGYPGEWTDLQIFGDDGHNGHRIWVKTENPRPRLKIEANWGHIFVKTPS